MPDCCDPKLLEGLMRQAWKNRLVYLVVAERRSYLPRPRLRSQTTTSMMAALNREWRASSAGPDKLSRAIGLYGSPLGAS
jgi:hypothetical protein